MTDQEILAGLAELVHEYAGTAVEDVAPGRTFAGDLRVDSLSMVEVLMAAEDRFGVQIPQEDTAGLRTVADAVAYIAAAQAARAAS